MRIFYFTTTGNSLAVARAIGGGLLSVREASKSGVNRWVDSEAIGLVCPVYFGRLPDPVEDWLGKVSLEAPYKFLVLTCGNTPAMSVKDGHGWDYVASIRMVDNYFPMFDVAKQVRDLPSKRVGEHLAHITADIHKHLVHRESPTLYGRIAGWYMRMFPLSPDAWRRFHIEDDKCTGCGVCGRLCPVENIVLKGSVPVIGARCLTCGACYHNCPVGAIRYEGEKSTFQYRNPAVTLADLMK